VSNPIQIYPNPTQDLITIEVHESLVHETYYIFDNFGRVLLFGKLDSEKQLVSLESLSTGTYIIKLSSGQVISKVMRFTN
jgi:hypothetical protein